MSGLVTVDGLAQRRDLYAILQRKDFERVLPLLVQLREHELEAGERERWLSAHHEEVALMRAVLTGFMSAEEAEDRASRYVRFRLLERPVNLVMLGLFLDDPRFVSEYVRIENAELLQAGEGALLACMHFGPHSGLPLLLAAAGHEASALLPKLELEQVTALANGYCPKTAALVQPLPVPDRLVLLRCRQALRSGRTVCIYMEASASDLHPKTLVPFLGREVRCPEGPALVAAAAGRPVVPALLLHDTDLRIRVVLDDPIAVGRGRDAMMSALSQLWRQLERRVLEHAEQWVGWEFFQQNMLVEVAGAEREGGPGAA